MRCHICDKLLSKDEIQYNPLHKDWDPCGVCLDVIYNLFEPKNEEELDKEISEESLTYELDELFT